MSFLYVASDERLEDRAERIDRVTDVLPSGLIRPRRQVAMVSWDGENIGALALLTRGQRVAAFKTGIRLTDFIALDPIPISDLIAALDSPHDRRLRRVRDGGSLPADTDAVLRAYFDGEEVGPWAGLEELAARETPSLWPEDRAPIVAYEREAVGLALSLAGLDRGAVLGTWNGDPEAPFLPSLDAFRAYEDSIIANDAQVFGDWERISGSVIGATRFEDRGRRLTVINVNRLEVEHNVGCDLVYYVHRYNAYILVQYKRLARVQDGWGYRPDSQLEKELERMRAIARPGQPSDDPNEHRLGEEFCFLKFCKPETDDPFSGELSAGMYVPLDLWDKLVKSGQLKGERGGTVLDYENVGRYITNSQFVGLVERAWIGTHGVSTTTITEVVERALDAGHSVILAAGESHRTRPHRFRGRA